MKKMKLRIVALLTSLLVSSPTLAKPALASNMIDAKTKEESLQAKNDKYKITKDTEDIRIVNYSENEAEFTLIYNKKEKSLTVKKNSNGNITTDVYRSTDPVPYSYFSPWKYSKKGNTYTLTAVVNLNTVTKTASYSGENVGHIDRFIDAVDDVKKDELALIGAMGFTAVSAIYTGGLSLPAAISAVYGMTQEANTMVEHYDRAEKAFLKVK